MLIPQKLATVSLKCKGTWVTVEVYELGDLESVTAPNGQRHFSRFCNYNLDNGPIEFLRVGFTTSGVPFSEEEITLLESWMPKAGLLSLIEALCGHIKPEVDNHVFLVPHNLDIDPQKTEMSFFRKRCRYDVLRVIHET